MMGLSVAAKASIVGAFVADAATMGLHWIYDTSKINDLVGDSQSPEFFNPPSCPFYAYESGRNSPWGDEELVLLQYLIRQQQKQQQQQKGSDDSSSWFPLDDFHSVLFDFVSTYDGRLNHLMVDFKDSYGTGGERGTDLKNGAENNQAHAMNKAVTLAAMYGNTIHDDDIFIATCRNIIASQQVNPMALDFGVGAALLLRHLLYNKETIEDQAPYARIAASILWLESFPKTPPIVVEALQRVKAEIADQSSQTKTYSGVDAVAKFGKSCALPGAFEGAIFFLLTCHSYTEAIRANILAGGDNCSRSLLIGASFAAVDPLTAVPDEWKQQTKLYHSHLQSLLSLHSHAAAEGTSSTQEL
jgi:hypothetical protein